MEAALPFIHAGVGLLIGFMIGRSAVKTDDEAQEEAAGIIEGLNDEIKELRDKFQKAGRNSDNIAKSWSAVTKILSLVRANNPSISQNDNEKAISQIVDKWEELKKATQSQHEREEELKKKVTALEHGLDEIFMESDSALVDAATIQNDLSEMKNRAAKLLGREVEKEESEDESEEEDVSEDPAIPAVTDPGYRYSLFKPLNENNTRAIDLAVPEP